jgi:hypothetical protein
MARRLAKQFDFPRSAIHGFRNVGNRSLTPYRTSTHAVVAKDATLKQRRRCAMHALGEIHKSVNLPLILPSLHEIADSNICSLSHCCQRSIIAAILCWVAYFTVVSRFNRAALF